MFSYSLTMQQNKLDCLSMAKHFQPNLMFASKASSLKFDIRNY
jgi:hypothetical protein